MPDPEETTARRQMRIARETGRFHALLQKELLNLPLTEEEQQFIKTFKIN